MSLAHPLGSKQEPLDAPCGFFHRRLACGPIRKLDGTLHLPSGDSHGLRALEVGTYPDLIHNSSQKPHQPPVHVHNQS